MVTLYSMWYNLKVESTPLLTVNFFRSEVGREPVKEWLRALPKEDRKVIGEDIKLVQFRWPLGMPLVRKLSPSLWELRSRLEDGRIGRTLFTVDQGEMILLHGFVKKSQKTPKSDLTLAEKRRDLWKGEK